MGDAEAVGHLRHAGCVGTEVNAECGIRNTESQRLPSVTSAPNVYIALGSNLGDSITLLQQAMAGLQSFSDQPLRKSSLWQSTPVDCPPGSPLFVNAVVALIPRPDETPELLLEKLQALELEFGREPKKVINEARPLDLDLIAFGTETRSTPHLILPHPRAHQRKFVLQPLSELAPELTLPGQVRNVRELLARLRTDEVLRRL
ncbi:MAG: 2-amino-4-hydroxy-6-hydroxymethyldihydropteridine diphosphokinase [Opitutaceae bacterium]|nr:2-amino-4-hydroxy-6-hydroxymethyldihydropteridine diphosphokinase [Verrucomicrobiales bacterium]